MPSQEGGARVRPVAVQPRRSGLKSMPSQKGGARTVGALGRAPRSVLKSMPSQEGGARGLLLRDADPHRRIEIHALSRGRCEIDKRDAAAVQAALKSMPSQEGGARPDLLVVHVHVHVLKSMPSQEGGASLRRVWVYVSRSRIEIHALSRGRCEGSLANNCDYSVIKELCEQPLTSCSLPLRSRRGQN